MMGVMPIGGFTGEIPMPLVGVGHMDVFGEYPIGPCRQAGPGFFGSIGTGPCKGIMESPVCGDVSTGP